MSYLAPEAKQSPQDNKQSNILEWIWKAQYDLRQLKIENEQEKIDWLIRRSSTNVLLWYMRNKARIKTSIILEREVILEFADEKTSTAYFYSIWQTNEELKPFFEYLIKLTESQKYIDDSTKAYNILNSFSKHYQLKIRPLMRKRPKYNLSHMHWLRLCVERILKEEKKDTMHVISKKSNTISKEDIEQPNSEKVVGIKIKENTILEDDIEQPKLEKAVGTKMKYNTISNNGIEQPESEKVVGELRNINTILERKNIEQQKMEKVVRHKKVAKSKEELTIESLLKEFPEATDNTLKERNPCPLEKCKIETPIGKMITINGERRIPHALLEGTREAIKKLEKTSIIQKSQSNWRNPIRPVLKDNGKVRICTNLIALNELVVKDDYPTPVMNDLIERVQGSNWFTVIDLKDGYFQIEVDSKDRHKTAFKFENNIYEWVRMPMGFKNAPSIFQRIMDRVLDDLINRGVEVYLDDIVIHAESKTEHDKLVREVLKRLEKNNLFINMEKIQFAKRQIKLLGVNLNGEKQCMIKEKKSGILEFPRPITKKALQRFLGKMNFYSGFIKGLNMIAAPLYEKVGTKTKFEWTETMENAFIKLKEELNKEIDLYLPDYNKKFILETDASNTGLGACLYQYNKDNRLVPIRWASKKLSPTEQRYGITEKELFAVVWGIKNFDYQLRGRQFHLITDHKALESIKKKGDFGNSRMSRWIEKIQEYDFTIQYKKGEEVISADALSRIYEDDKDKNDLSLVNNKLSPKWKENTFIKDNIEYYKMKNGINKIVPNAEERKQLIVKVHEELIHRGLESTYYELLKTYFWPGMKKSIENIIKKCEICNQNNRKNFGGEEFIETSEPLEKSAIDILSLGEEELKVLIWIDYFTRLIKIKILKNRKTEEILKNLEEIFKETGYPKEINTDNAKEFISLEFEKYCVEKNISHHQTSVENHRSNGRVERIIRTIRDGVVKLKNISNVKEKLIKIQNAYNATYHSAIHMSPEEAWRDNTGTVSLLNSKKGKYAKQFKKLKRELFEIGQQVRIAQKENLNTKGESKGKSNLRYQDIGVIISRCGKDSYIVKDSSGKIKKKSHCDLKGMKVL